MNTPIYSQLLKHQNLDYSPFHTPGHKNTGFFPKNLLNLDFTELPDTDALYEADGIISETENNLARLFSAKRSLISSGGCTLAIQTMLRLASQKGNKILFARNIHRSAVNACALLGITPQWVVPQSENGLFTGRISPKDVENAFLQDKNISALYVTSPDYYGELSDIQSLADICHQYGKLLLVDNAHGSHLAFLKNNQHPISLGADMSACSLHKTMPVLTGGAVLNIGNESLADNAKSAMSLFGSTSPSYPIMASIDLCCDYMLNGNGIADYQHLEERAAKIKQSADRQGLLQPNGSCDPARVCINTSYAGIAPEKQIEFFHTHQVEPEFCDGKNAVFICTPFNSEKDFSRLEKAITALHRYTDKIDEPFNGNLPQIALTPREAIFAETEIISIDNALGRISADSACPCPPGIPVVMPGEMIDNNVILGLKKYGFDYIKAVK